jgi:putative transcriptional regulator
MMEETFGQSVIAGLTEAVEIATGKKAAARTHVIEVPDVRSIREQLGQTQEEFATNYRIPLPTLRGWEQGRRQPDATASAYLSVIASLPQETRAALA